VLWDLRSGSSLTQFYTNVATALAWRGTRVALGHANGAVSLWELHNS
jgi:hypothetical protein